MPSARMPHGPGRQRERGVRPRNTRPTAVRAWTRETMPRGRPVIGAPPAHSRRLRTGERAGGQPGKVAGVQTKRYPAAPAVSMDDGA